MNILSKKLNTLYETNLIDNYLYYNINESAFFISSKIKNILDNTPKVTKKEFYSRVQTGDIIVGFSPKSVIKDYPLAKVISKIMASVQGSPYTTSKLVVDKDTAIGYGIRRLDKDEKNRILTYPIKKLVFDRQELCLIRIKDATNDQKEKAVDYMLKRIGVEYDGLSLYKTAWDRFFKMRLLFIFNEPAPEDNRVLRHLKTPLICSNIIAVAYRVAGYTRQFNRVKIFRVWPKDFLLDENTEKICRVEYSY